MKRISTMGMLRIACALAVVGLLLMMWSLFDPHAQPVLLALSLGQLVGTTSFVLYLCVILRDYRASRGGPSVSLR